MAKDSSPWPDFDFSSLNNVAKQLQESTCLYRQALEPLLRMQQEWQATLAPLLKSQASFAQVIDRLDVLGVAEFRKQLDLAEFQKQLPVAHAAEYQKQLDELLTPLASVPAQMREAAARATEAIEREAAARGLTVDDLFEALRESDEVVKDLEKLKQLQEARAWRLFHLRESSVVELLRALPPDRRPLRADFSGIADSDFRPLISGVTRKA